MQERKYTILYDELAQEVGIVAAAIAGKVIAYCGAKDQCQVSLKRLADDLGISYNTMKTGLEKLQTKGYIEYTNGDGRGCCSTIKRCQNLIPFQAKRYQNMDEKVSKTDTFLYNNNYNKNIVCNTARSRTRQTNKKEVVIMEDFNLFWQLFKADDQHSNEYDRSAAIWSLMSPEVRECVIDGLRLNDRLLRRADKGGGRQSSPFLYLQDYDVCRERRYSTNDLLQRYGTTDVKGFCILEAKGEDGRIRYMRVTAARMNKQPIMRVL